VEPGLDPALVELALTAFVSLPPAQRSAVILKDVLGHSLEETASTMGNTVLAVKGALVRARANIAASKPSANTSAPAGISSQLTEDERFGAPRRTGIAHSPGRPSPSRPEAGARPLRAESRRERKCQTALARVGITGR
jgi:hypothetical protein